MHVATYDKLKHLLAFRMVYASPIGDAGKVISSLRIRPLSYLPLFEAIFQGCVFSLRCTPSYSLQQTNDTNILSEDTLIFLRRGGWISWPGANGNIVTCIA